MSSESPTDPGLETAALAPRGRASRFWLYAPFSLLALIIIAWTAFWFYAAHRVGDVIDTALASEASRNRIWACPDRRIGGFPFRIEVSCDHPTYRGAIAGAAAHGDVRRFSALAQIYQPSLVLAEVQGPFAVASDDGARTLTLDWTRLQMSLHMQGNRLARFDLVGDKPTMSLATPQTGSGSGSADGAQIHIRQSPDRPPGEADYEIAVMLTKGLIPSLDALSAIAGPLDIDARVRITDTERLDGSPAAIEAWRRDGGRLDVTGLQVSKGTASVAASGTLTLDDARRPAGQIDATLVGLEPVLQRLGVPPAASAIGGLLGGLLGGGRAQAGTPQRNGLPLTLVLRDGRLSVGPIRLPVLLPPVY